MIFRNKTLVINGQIWYYKFRLNWNSIQPMRRRVGMADEADSKSVVGNHVRVQVPPPAVQTDLFLTDGSVFFYAQKWLLPIFCRVRIIQVWAVSASRLFRPV